MVFLQVLGGSVFIFVSAFFLWIVSKAAKLENRSFAYALRTAALVGIITMSLNQIIQGMLDFVVFAITVLLSIVSVKRFHASSWLKSVIAASAWAVLTTGTTIAMAYLLGFILIGAGFNTIASVG